MNGEEIIEALGQRFDAVDAEQNKQSNRLTSIETLMGERCKVNTARIHVLEASGASYGQTLAKHAVVIGLALAALTALLVVGSRLL